MATPVQGNQVKFFYAASTTALPQNKDNDTVYFDAQARAIYVGNNLVAADNAVNTSGFVTNTSLATTLEDYVTKIGTELGESIHFKASAGSTLGNTVGIIGFTSGVMYVSDASNNNVIIQGIATPTVTSDAATKGYVDAQVASAGQTWTVG